MKGGGFYVFCECRGEDGSFPSPVLSIDMRRSTEYIYHNESNYIYILADLENVSNAFQSPNHPQAQRRKRRGNSMHYDYYLNREITLKSILSCSWIYNKNVAAAPVLMYFFNQTQLF